MCAGPKAILDVPLTLEYLETRGVPVVSVGIDEVPGFYSRLSGIPAPSHVPDIAAAAAVIRAHEAMGLTSGLVICNPVPEADALPLDIARAAIEQAIREADEAGISGAAVTPWLLARVADDHRRRLRQGEHLADHEQRPRRRASSRGRSPPDARGRLVAQRRASAPRGQLSPEPRRRTQHLSCAPCS